MTTPENATELPWLACTAAIELCPQSLPREQTFVNVAALARRLRSELGNILSAVMLWDSLSVLRPDYRTQVQTVDQLTLEINALSVRLQAIADAPELADPTEVHTMRDYALHLSTIASTKQSERRRSYRHLAV